MPELALPAGLDLGTIAMYAAVAVFALRYLAGQSSSASNAVAKLLNLQTPGTGDGSEMDRADALDLIDRLDGWFASRKETAHEEHIDALVELAAKKR